MVALTYSEAPAATATKSVAKTAPVAEAPRKTFLARFLDAMMEARMKQAQREIRLYSRHIGE